MEWRIFDNTKTKNIRALHQSIYEMKHEKALKCHKSEVRVEKRDRSILELDGIFLENVFFTRSNMRMGTIFRFVKHVPETGKEMNDTVIPGKLVGFVRNDEIWTLEPETAFYDYIYISRLIKILAMT